MSYYPQQQANNSLSMHNFVPVMPTGSSQYRHGIPLTPILLQQTPNGPLQYVYPAPTLTQAPILTSDRQYAPVIIRLSNAFL
jgi:hypothetical protein